MWKGNVISGESVKKQVSLLKLVLISAAFFIIQWGGAPVEIDKKHKKIKWHLTNNNIFQLQQRVSNALKIIQNFNYNKRKINFRFRVFGCFVFEFWVLHFRSRGLHFRVFGCFMLQSSYSKLSVQWNVITFYRVLTKSFRHITRTSASTILQDTSKITLAYVYTLILTGECHLSIDRGVLCIIETECQLGHSLPPQN